WRDLVISRFGTKDAGAGMLIPSGRTDVFRRRPERGLHLVLGERRIGLLQERDDPGSDRRRSRRAAVTVEVAGEMRDRAEVGFVGIKGGGTTAAVADELFVLVDGPDSHHPRMSVGAPDALAGTCVRATSAVRAGVAAISRCKQHENTFVDGVNQVKG